MTSPPRTGNAVFRWLLLAWPRINHEAELGGISCRSRDARFVFVETNSVGMSAYWWWPWWQRGDSVSSLHAVCVWTREYVVINFKKVVFLLNLSKIIPTWAQRMGGLWALERRSRPAGCWWKLCNCEMFKNADAGSNISHTTMILHDLFIIFGPETWSCEPLGCGRDRVRSLQLRPPCGLWSVNDYL